MTATDLQLARLASHQTSAIAIILFAGSLVPTQPVIAQNNDVDAPTDSFSISNNTTSTPSYHSVQVVDTNDITDSHLVTAFLELHDRLITEQKELDVESESLLCQNLWDLYI